MVKENMTVKRKNLKHLKRSKLIRTVERLAPTKVSGFFISSPLIPQIKLHAAIATGHSSVHLRTNLRHLRESTYLCLTVVKQQHFT